MCKFSQSCLHEEPLDPQYKICIVCIPLMFSCLTYHQSLRYTRLWLLEFFEENPEIRPCKTDIRINLDAAFLVCIIISVSGIVFYMIMSLVWILAHYREHLESTAMYLLDTQPWLLFLASVISSCILHALSCIFDNPCILKSIPIPSMGMKLKLGLPMLVGLWTCPNDKRHYIYTLTNAFLTPLLS